MRKIEFTVSDAHNNLKLEQFLRDHHGVSHKIIVKAKQSQDGLMINGIHARTIDVIHPGDIVTVILYEPSQNIIKNNLNVEIIYEDNDYIVFNKPREMPVHPSMKHNSNTLANHFMYYFSQKNQDLTFRAINRLDKNTSGIVIVAKNAHASNNCKNIEKEYLALVEGKMEDDTGTISEPIKRESLDSQKRIVSEDGKSAVTCYEVIDKNENYSLVKINLKTGRTHQIRVHFSFLNHPLAGDDLYGGHDDLISGHALHCFKTSFKNGITDKEINLTAKIPIELINAIKEAGLSTDF